MMTRSIATLSRLLLWLVVCGLFSLTAGRASAQATQIFDSSTPTTERTLDPGSVHDGKHIIVRGITLTINGAHNFASLTLENNAVVTHSAGFEGGMNLTIAGNLIINLGSLIHANGCGYPSAQGPGVGGNDTSGSYGGGGGAYGGESYGRIAVGGAINGSVKQPAFMGSGGGIGFAGSYAAGAGGGYLRLNVGNTLRVDGRIEANGSGADRAGAGSGGGIYIDAREITGNGLITADGGYSNDSAWPHDRSGGGGSGGRIAIYHRNAISDFSGGIRAAGGGSRSTGVSGAGTIYLKHSSQTQGDLWVHNNGNSGLATILPTPHTFDNVRIWGRGILAPPAMGTLEVTTLGDFTIETDGYVSADGRGHAPGLGAGAGGHDASGSYGGGGGAYGGEAYGRVAVGGITYGGVKEPLDLGDGEHLGSGGGNGFANSYWGGSGGGAIRLTVGNVLKVDGRLTVNGNGADRAGAGSGGSLWLNVRRLSGIGFITADGGYSNDSIWPHDRSGGGGGGGRIVIRYSDSINDFLGENFTGDRLRAAGGGSRSTGVSGAGTIYLKHPSQTQGDLWLHNNGNSGLQTVLTELHVFDNIRIWRQGWLSPAPLRPLEIMVLGNCVIEQGGYISAWGRGYPGSQGTAPGQDGIGSYGGGGGGHGGRGRTTSGGAGGDTYGSLELPLTYGSGGGTGFSASYGGGNGGGVVRLTVNGTLQAEGELSANGVGVDRAGAGAGGSLLLRVGELAGRGTVSADGGYSNDSAWPHDRSGGGGGGGRVAIYYRTMNFEGTKRAAGGGSRSFGTADNGTVYEQQTASNAMLELIVSQASLGGGQEAVGQITLSEPAPEGGLSIALASSDPSAVTVPPGVTIPAGETSAAFTINAQSVTQTKTAQISARLWDMQRTQTITVKPWIAAFRVSPDSVVGGATVTGTLTLNQAAPTGGLTVTLESSQTAVNLPASVTFQPGTLTRTFTFTVGAVTQAVEATLRARYGDETLSTSLFLNRTGVSLRSLLISPPSVVGGANATGVVTLAASSSSDTLISLSSSDPSVASVPRSVRVPAGATSASFTIATNPVATVSSVLIRATLGATLPRTLTVRPPGVGSLVLVPDTVSGGENAVGIVTLNAVPIAPVTVTVSSDNPAAVPTTQIVIPAGETVGTFEITTSTVATPVSALITAQANGTPKSQTLTITPPTSVTVSGVISLQNVVDSVQSITFRFRPTQGDAFDRTVMLSAAGEYSLSGIPRGTYSVRIKGAKWLAKSVTVDTSGGGATLNATLFGGDANDDNSVDITDLLILISAYNQQRDVNAGYRSEADFDCNGTNDISDLLLLIGNYNRRGDD